MLIFFGQIMRWIIAMVFIYAGALKLLDPAAFAWNIYQYGLVPRPLIEPLAIALPVLEVMSGVALIANRRGSYGAVAGMLVLFMAILGYALISGLNVECGCFGSGEPGPEGLRKAFLRDAVMIVGLGVSWWFRRQPSVPERTDSQ